MQRGRVTDQASIREFIMAGKAHFTLVSVATQTRFTYRVKRPNENTPWFVSVLTGSDNDSSYSVLGTIFPGTVYRPGDVYRYNDRKSRIGADAPSAKAFRWFWAHITAGQLPDVIEFWHEGRCGRCGRRLTVPESVERGIGPECAGIIGADSHDRAEAESDAEWHRLEAQADREGTIRDERAKRAARAAMEA